MSKQNEAQGTPSVKRTAIAKVFDIIFCAHADQTGGVEMAFQLCQKFLGRCQAVPHVRIAIACPNNEKALAYAKGRIMSSPLFQHVGILPVEEGLAIVKSDSGSVDPYQTHAVLIERFGSESLRQSHLNGYCDQLRPHVRPKKTLIVSCGESTALKFAHDMDMPRVIVTDMLLPDALREVLAYGGRLTSTAAQILSYFADFDRMALDAYLAAPEFSGANYDTYFIGGGVRVLGLPSLFYDPIGAIALNPARNNEPLQNLCDAVGDARRLAFVFGGGGPVWADIYRQAADAYRLANPKPQFCLLVPAVEPDAMSSGKLRRVRGAAPWSDETLFKYWLFRPDSHTPIELLDPGSLASWYARANLVVGRGGLVAQQVLALLLGDPPPAWPQLLFVEERGHPQIEHERQALTAMGFVQSCTLEHLIVNPLRVIEDTMGNITPHDTEILRLRVRARYSLHGLDRAIDAILHEHLNIGPSRA